MIVNDVHICKYWLVRVLWYIYINSIIISIVYEDDDFARVVEKKRETELEKLLAVMVQLREDNAELKIQQKELLRSHAAMAKNVEEMTVKLNSVHKTVVPRFLRLPLRKFKEEQSDQLVIHKEWCNLYLQ